MNHQESRYNPDYAVPPGWILGDELERLNISPEEFARRCGLSAELINAIIAGDTAIDPETAERFNRQLGGCASIRLRMEHTYRRRRTGGNRE